MAKIGKRIPYFPQIHIKKAIAYKLSGDFS
jgi:hypothetical protein